jgi:hypothetical protein
MGYSAVVLVRSDGTLVRLLLRIHAALGGAGLHAVGRLVDG